MIYRNIIINDESGTTSNWPRIKVLGYDLRCGRGSTIEGPGKY
jgi:hypothetical protein